MPTLIIFIEHIIGSPSQSNWEKKRNKRQLNLKGRSEIVYVDDMILLYIENTKDVGKNC